MGVEAWDRDILAKDEMQLTSDPVEAALDDHIYFSKEASSGGRGFGGGCTTVKTTIAYRISASIF